VDGEVHFCKQLRFDPLFTLFKQLRFDPLFTDTIAIQVQVLDQVELDVLLKAKWEEMKSSLIDNNLMERVYGEVMESMERVKP